jgi:hypothetical protein
MKAHKEVPKYTITEDDVKTSRGKKVQDHAEEISQGGRKEKR